MNTGNNTPETEYAQYEQNRRRIIGGIVLLFLGSILLLGQLGWIRVGPAAVQERIVVEITATPPLTVPTAAPAVNVTIVTNNNQTYVQNCAGLVTVCQNGQGNTRSYSVDIGN